MLTSLSRSSGPWTIEYSNIEASLPNILTEDFLCLRNSSTELQILVDSQTWFEVLKNVGCINPKTILHRLDSKTISVPKLYTPSTLNNSNETHTFICLGRVGRFGQH